MLKGLKPCLVCGGKADLCIWNGGGVSWVRCSECGADIEAKPHPYLAAKKWNTRVERTCEEGLDCGGCEHESDHEYCWTCSRHFPDMFTCHVKVVE